ncbi:MAG: Plug domain-containing protein, partial [Gammaproteobacteria bacterium]|nr:Plug domain-containing protein [Gammaproteobacteria bacterium]
MKAWRQIVSMLAWLGPAAMPVVAQTGVTDAQSARQNVTAEQDVVTYPATFFSRYQPNSALDMLEQLPGFRMASSGELRGYGSDTGNVLINGRRPSSKRVTVPSVLDRIPAS